MLFCWLAKVPLTYFTVGTVVGNTLMALVVTFLLRRLFRFENRLEKIRDVASYLILACGIGSLLAAGANAAGLALIAVAVALFTVDIFR